MSRTAFRLRMNKRRSGEEKAGVDAAFWRTDKEQRKNEMVGNEYEVI